jgi:hypothetical protein
MTEVSGVVFYSTVLLVTSYFPDKQTRDGDLKCDRYAMRGAVQAYTEAAVLQRALQNEGIYEVVLDLCLGVRSPDQMFSNDGLY